MQKLAKKPLTSIRKISLSCACYIKIDQQNIYVTVFHHPAFPGCLTATIEYLALFEKVICSGLCSDLRKPFTFTPFELISKLLFNCHKVLRKTGSISVRGRFSQNFFHIPTSTARGSKESTLLRSSIPKVSR